jgi:hypothetical protein
MNKLLPLLAALALTACPPGPEVPVGPKPKPIGQDAAVLPDGALATPCEAVCAAYRGLGCPEGLPTPRGHTCEEVCQNAAVHGIDLGGDVNGCIVRAETCEDVRGCSR